MAHIQKYYCGFYSEIIFENTANVFQYGFFVSGIMCAKSWNTKMWKFPIFFHLMEKFSEKVCALLTWIYRKFMGFIEFLKFASNLRDLRNSMRLLFLEFSLFQPSFSIFQRNSESFMNAWMLILEFCSNVVCNNKLIIINTFSCSDETMMKFKNLCIFIYQGPGILLYNKLSTILF